MDAVDAGDCGVGFSHCTLTSMISLVMCPLQLPCMAPSNYELEFPVHLPNGGGRGFTCCRMIVLEAQNQMSNAPNSGVSWEKGQLTLEVAPTAVVVLGPGVGKMTPK